MKNILIIIISIMLLFALPGCKPDEDSKADQTKNTPGKTQLKKLSLSSINNIGIKSAPKIQSSISYDMRMSLVGDSTADSGLLSVDASGDIQAIGQLGGVSITPIKIIPIENSDHVVINYQDTDGYIESYLIDSSDDAHLLEFPVIEQDGLRNSPFVFYFPGNYFYKNSQNNMVKGYFDSSGDYQEKILFNDLVYFTMDKLGNFMIAANDNIYVGYANFEETGRIWPINNAERFVGVDGRGSKLFFENNIQYAGNSAGGFVIWNDLASNFQDVYLNPDCSDNVVFCRTERQVSRYTMDKPERNDCQQKYINSKNWIICNGLAFNANGINEVAIRQDLSYVPIANMGTAKRAISGSYVYFGTSEKLVKVDLDNQISYTLIEGYNIESLTVSNDDEVLFSGKDPNGRNVLIKIKSDSSITEIDLQGNVVSEIKVIK